MDNAEDIVRSLYRAILIREGDADGIRHHAAFLRAGHGLSNLSALITMFIKSAEFRNRLISPEFNIVRKGVMSGPYYDETPVNYVMSIGPACYVSGLLDRWNLRRFAGPFDWMFSSIRMVEHVLRDEFRTFLSRDEMEPIAMDNGEIRVHHRFYAPHADYMLTGSEPIFFHHNPLDPEKYEHFQRAAQRTMFALSKRALLFTVVKNTERNVGDFYSLVEFLMQSAPESQVLAILVNEGAADIAPALSPALEIGRHRAFTMNSLGPITIYGFENYLDEITIMRVVFRTPMDLKSFDGVSALEYSYMLGAKLET